MTTTACAFDKSAAVSQGAFEIATITPGYAAIRAHRPLKSRMGSRAALLGSSVLAGAFGLFAAEAMAQQYNFSGSGGFTDVSSSINVVTDAGAGNIRVILADGVQFVASPGQYQLNPMTNQLQVSTDVLLGAYTGGAPVTAVQTSQAMMASQGSAYATSAPFALQGQQLAQASFGAATSMATYQPQVYTAGQYASQPSIVGGYQMQPSAANLAYNPPMAPNMNPQATQYVPAYSAGAQMAQMQPSYGGAATTFGQTSFGQPSYGMQGGFGAQNMYGNAAAFPVTQAVPMAEVAAAPAPVASSGGMFGLPSWALVGGGVVAAGAAVMAMGGLGGASTGTTTTNTSTSTNYSASQAAFLNDPAVQAALYGTTTDDDDDSSSESSDTGSSDGIVIEGGSGDDNTTTDSSSNSGASATIAAGREDDDVTGTSGDDTVTFRAAEDAEEFNSLDLSGGDDTVVLEDMTSDVTPGDLNNVENLEVQVESSGHTLDMANVGDDVDTVSVEAKGHSITISNVESIGTIAVSGADTELVTIGTVDSGNTVSLTESDNAKITAGSVLTVNVNEVNDAVEVLATTALTVDVADDTDNAFALTTAAVKSLIVTGDGALTVTNDIGDSDLAAVTSFDASAAGGHINVAVDGSGITDVDTGSAGDMLHIKTSAANAAYDTNGGNDTVEIDDFASGAVLNTGSGGDKIELDTALTASNQKIDGGDGSDTLEVTEAVTAGDYDNIETLEISGNVKVDLERFDSDLETVEVARDQIVDLEMVKSSHDIEVGEGSTLKIKSGTGSTASFIVGGDATIFNDTNVTEVEDLKISFTGSTATTLELTGTTTQSIEIDEASATVSLVGPAITAGGTDAVSSIVATALTTSVVIGVDANNGAINIRELSLGSGGDTVYIEGGQAGADIDTGAGNDTIDASENDDDPMDYIGGAGKDSISLNATNNIQDEIVYNAAGDFVVVTSGSTTNLDTVSGFESGVDKIDLNALNLTGMSDEGTSLTDAYNAVSDGSVDVAFATDGGNTYVYVDLGTTIGAIEVTGETLKVGDFDL